MGRFVLPLIAVALLPAASGCVPKRAQTPQPASSALVVLLPDPGTSTAGNAAVSNDKGRVELAEAGAAASVSPGAAPRAMTLQQEEVQRIFGEVEIAEEANQGGEDAPRLGLVNLVHQPPDLFGWILDLAPLPCDCHTHVANRCALRAFALAISSSRLFGSAGDSSASRS